MTNAIELQNVVKSFGAKRAVDGVSFSIPEGSVFGLIGPNGAGKTTTFSMLAGYLEPTEGTARVLGAEPTDVGALKGRLGVLPQDALLPANEPAGSFLLYLARMQGISASAAEPAVRKALETVGGAEWWSVECKKLSHGMAKRVGIAQALLGDPKVVLLDEPTAGLDPKVAFGVRQVIKGLTGKCTVVISSHNLQELEEICDRAAILDRGKLVAHGTMSELTANNREFTIELAPTSPEHAMRGSVPFAEVVRAIAGVTSVQFDGATGRMLVMHDTSQDPDAIVAYALRALLDNGARVRGLSRGRSLEQRVMELT
ncbi:MAG: ABC transporter ATP-binding protein [Myxococcales bacterium]|nr:ABC transporter ATP-binding protein [Myxococcales bacterium]